MLRNLLTESDLTAYAVKLGDLLYTGQSNYSEQKTKATQFVFNQLIQRRYDVKELMPELILRNSGSSINLSEVGIGVQDTINRLRLVIDNIVNTVSAKSVTLQGSNDNSTFTDIMTLTISVTDTSRTETFFDTYKYYRINTSVVSGAIDFRASLVETVYDELFAYKWLVFIYSDIRKAEGDQFDLKIQYYESMYLQLLNSAVLYIDSTSDGVPDSERSVSTINFLK